MTEDRERGDDLVEGGENPAQNKIGEGEDRPVDVSWAERKWGESGGDCAGGRGRGSPL